MRTIKSIISSICRRFFRKTLGKKSQKGHSREGKKPENRCLNKDSFMPQPPPGRDQSRPYETHRNTKEHTAGKWKGKDAVRPQPRAAQIIKVPRVKSTKERIKPKFKAREKRANASNGESSHDTSDMYDNLPARSPSYDEVILQRHTEYGLEATDYFGDAHLLTEQGYDRHGIPVYRPARHR